MAIRLNPDLLPDLLFSIQQSRENLDTATQQLSTQKKVNSLSDDPSAVASLVHNHDQAGQDDQFLKNQSTLQAQFQVADSTLSNVITVLTRAVSIGTEGANGTLNNADRLAIAGEVQGLANQLLSLANVSYQGVCRFAESVYGLANERKHSRGCHASARRSLRGQYAACFLREWPESDYAQREFFESRQSQLEFTGKLFDRCRPRNGGF